MSDAKTQELGITQTCAYACKMEASMLLPGLTPSLEMYDAVLPTIGQDLPGEPVSCVWAQTPVSHVALGS